MDKRLKLNSEITAGPQPSEQDLQELALEGYKSVVNLRFAGEQAEQPTPTAEGELAHRLGMHYEHLPVAMREMEAEKVDQFLRAYPALPKPIFIHCQSGKRAGAFALLRLAAEHGWSGRQAIEQAEQMHIECTQPPLRAFVESYADHHVAT